MTNYEIGNVVDREGKVEIERGGERDGEKESLLHRHVIGMWYLVFSLPIINSGVILKLK